MKGMEAKPDPQENPEETMHKLWLELTQEVLVARSSREIVAWIKKYEGPYQMAAYKAGRLSKKESIFPETPLSDDYAAMLRLLSHGKLGPYRRPEFRK